MVDSRFILPMIASMLFGCALFKGEDKELKKWQQSGGNAYSEFFKKTQKNSAHHFQSLSDADKESLRPYFGKLVDEVKVAWNSKLSSGIGNEPYAIDFADTADAKSRSVGRYIMSQKNPKKLKKRQRLKILIHQLSHCQQYSRSKSSFLFGKEMFRQFYESGKNYQNTPWETRAIQNQKKWLKQALNNEK